MLYLLTIWVCNETSILGIYSDKKMLVEDYDMLLKRDERFEGYTGPRKFVNIFDIIIYRMEPNKFYGIYTEWGGNEKGRFYEILDCVSIDTLREENN